MSRVVLDRSQGYLTLQQVPPSLLFCSDSCGGVQPDSLSPVYFASEPEAASTLQLGLCEDFLQ